MTQAEWIETLKAWAKPPSETEEDKASRAARMINDAVRETKILDGRDFTVYATGSYRNNTNIKADSDVDIALVLEDAFWYTIPSGMKPEVFGLGATASYGLTEFRADIHRALVGRFDKDVKPGNKTFNIVGNSGRLPADVTPFLVHKEYSGRRLLDGTWEVQLGVETRPKNDGNKRIINWHKHHYDNGVKKNMATNRRFKRVTRILKRLKIDMQDNGTQEARASTEPIASFLIESLMYNAPLSCFNLQDGSYYEDVKTVITRAWNQTKDDQLAAGLVEVNERKALFGAGQAWTRAQTHEFLVRAWIHVGFEQ